jgi:hypothetical protein
MVSAPSVELKTCIPATCPLVERLYRSPPEVIERAQAIAAAN